MGATASVQLLYQEGFEWFKSYVDTETYVTDFHSIDKDADGSISYMELNKWIRENAKRDKAWNIFVDNSQVLTVAHKSAAVSSSGGMYGSIRPEKVVDLSDFRCLLIQLFTTSILWTHFKNADTWADGDDVGNKQLNFEEFRLACTSLTQAYAHELITPEQLQQDFETLDTNLSGSIGFIEICNYCAKFVAEVLTASAAASLVNSRTSSRHIGQMIAVAGQAPSLADTMIPENVELSQESDFFIPNSPRMEAPTSARRGSSGGAVGTYMGPLMNVMEELNSHHVDPRHHETVESKNRSAIRVLADRVESAEVAAEAVKLSHLTTSASFKVEDIHK